MCVTYTIRYACGDEDSVKDAANGCDGKCTGDNIRYDESLDENSTENCLIHTHSMSPAKTHSSSDSEVSDHPPEDPQPEPEQPEQPRKIAPKAN
jgi:hypothetical protein